MYRQVPYAQSCAAAPRQRRVATAIRRYLRGLQAGKLPLLRRGNRCIMAGRASRPAHPKAKELPATERGILSRPAVRHVRPSSLAHLTSHSRADLRYFLAGPSLSSRAIREACRLAGTATDGDGMAAAASSAAFSPPASSTAGTEWRRPQAQQHFPHRLPALP